MNIILIIYLKGNKLRRWLVKLNASDGSEVWQLTFPTNDGMGNYSGFFISTLKEVVNFLGELVCFLMSSRPDK